MCIIYFKGRKHFHEAQEPLLSRPIESYVDNSVNVRRNSGRPEVTTDQSSLRHAPPESRRGGDTTSTGSGITASPRHADPITTNSAPSTIGLPNGENRVQHVQQRLERAKQNFYNSMSELQEQLEEVRQLPDEDKQQFDVPAPSYKDEDFWKM